MISSFVAFVLFLRFSFGQASLEARRSNDKSSKSPVLSPLDVFQVQAPLRKSYEGASCQQVVLQHDFTSSYGSPYIGQYLPPTCDFTTAIFNLSVTSIGINYDRLSSLFFGDIEVWRTTTAMPVRTGIFWNFQKDMSIFDTLLRSKQKVIMELDNLFDSVFTGDFNVTITALYYNDHKQLSPADLILPISAQLSASNQSSLLSVPDQNASVSLTFPKNAERAVVSVLASGNGNEEFWYTLVPSEYSNTFSSAAISGHGPFREVQVLIDGKLAGVGWPNPTIFTGGISPGLWVPIVGIDTYDLPSFEVEISPWLGVLCDGKAHTFELNVVGYDSKTVMGTVNFNWWVSGAVFVWLDDAGNQTTGTNITSSIPLPSFDFNPRLTASANTNTSLLINLTAARSLSHTSIITTSSGSQTLCWNQDLTFSTSQMFYTRRNKTLSQLTTISNTFTPSHRSNWTNSTFSIANHYSYPLAFRQNYTIPVDPTITNSSIYAELDRSVIYSEIPLLEYFSSIDEYVLASLNTRQNGSCIYGWNDTYYESAGAIDPAKGTTGATEQWFSFKGLIGGEKGEYGRHVKAVDGYEPVLVLDESFGEVIDVPETDLGKDEL